MAALLRESVHGRKDRKRESVEQEDMRKLADDLLDLAGKSPTSSLEIAHARPDRVAIGEELRHDVRPDEPGASYHDHCATGCRP